MICIYTHLYAFASLSGVFSLLSLKYYILFFLSAPACRVIRGCRAVCPLSIGHALEALRRPAVLSPLSGCPLVVAVTRPSSGAKRYDSGGRCSAYMSPALSPLAYVLPCVPSLVPCLVPWLPSVRPCVCPAAVCRLVVVIGGTPLFRGRLRCGAASVM